MTTEPIYCEECGRDHSTDRTFDFDLHLALAQDDPRCDKVFFLLDSIASELQKLGFHSEYEGDKASAVNSPDSAFLPHRIEVLQ